MPLITPVPRTWTETTLTANEVWQARGGTVLVSSESDPDDDEGLVLFDTGVGLTLASGITIKYRAQTARPTKLYRFNLGGY